MSLNEQEMMTNPHDPLHEEIVDHESDNNPCEEGCMSEETDPVQKETSEKEQNSTHHDSPHMSAHRQRYEEFLKEVESKSDVESKLQACIDFMSTSLAQGGTPHFRSFWDARTLCLQLFKENVSPVVRSILWNKYNELSKEARRLKEILDEQSAFAVEQIEIAIKALEDDIEGFQAQLERLSDADMGEFPVSLEHSAAQYKAYQKELNLLNTQASRINALRKELMRTEMRVKQKNKFFQRLSAAGDKVFPRRKDLIKEVSTTFINDVDQFIQSNFQDEKSKQPLFALREEIKALQNVAKVLTLNTHAFTHTRMRLSQCWDEIKGEEKERKKEKAQQKAVFKQNYDEALAKIHAFRDKNEAEPLPPREALKQLEEISIEIRQMHLGREENQALKEEFLKIKNPILELLDHEDRARKQGIKDKENERVNKIQELKTEIQQLIATSESSDFQTLNTRRDEILEKIGSLNLSKAEKMEVERHLKPLKDVISEKKENSLLDLSDDKRQARQQLREVLRQRKERRKEIKDQLDQLRRQKSGSGLDFTQAMSYNKQMEEEKDRLEKIDESIQEIEDKIADLEGR